MNTSTQVTQLTTTEIMNKNPMFTTDGLFSKKSCYKDRLSCTPVFDRIEITFTIDESNKLLCSWYMQHAVVPLFPVVCTISTVSPKH